MRCEDAERLMTMANDGEIGWWRRRRFDRHLAACASCRRAMDMNTRLLAAVSFEAESDVPTHVEQEVLRRVRQAAAEEQGREGQAWWAPLSVPAVLAAAAVLVAVGLFRDGDEGPGGGAVPGARPTPSASRAVVPPADPPAELATNPDLFIELPILRNLEKLSNFEAIRTTTLDRRSSGLDDHGRYGNG